MVKSTRRGNGAAGKSVDAKKKKKGGSTTSNNNVDETTRQPAPSQLQAAPLLAFLVALLAILAHTFRGRGDGGASDDSHAGNHLHNQTTGFYAWTSPPLEDGKGEVEVSLMSALFPELSRFQSAWEDHPLLSRVTFHPDAPNGQLEQHDDEYLDEMIPTIYHDRSVISKLSEARYNGDDPITSLLDVDQVGTIVFQPDMRHGDDYKLVKKIVMPPGDPNAGEEYNGIIPGEKFTREDILYAFHYGAFSIVANRVQNRWNAVAKMARKMEEEFASMQVGANLYLTPQVKLETEKDKEHGVTRQGFENHWDWMDVIVVQLSGRKRWSVARDPAVYLSEKDMKRKPTNREGGSFRRYDDFTLCPGDVLYIPRGHIHNASTVLFDDLFGGNAATDDDGKRSTDLDRCPSYPSNVASARVLSERVGGPSLHVTFGLLAAGEHTMESLLHHALDEFFASPDNLPRGFTSDDIAISAGTHCPSSSSLEQAPTKHNLKWKAIMHHALSEVTRRPHLCDGIMHLDSLTESKSIDSAEYKCDDGATVLRKSVPLLLLENNIMKPTIMFREDKEQQVDNLHQTYLTALRTFATLASMSKLVQFTWNLVQRTPDDDQLNFYYPGYAEEDVITCPDLLRTVPENTFDRLVESFDTFAEDHFFESFKGLNVRGKKRRDVIRQRQQMELKKAGQL